ncbi:MAG: EF-hand domain-containing protein, partial [Gallionellaceae bacterium]
MATVSGVSNMREAAMPQAKPASKPISPQQKISNLFQQIDTAGTGRITKAQFEQAFTKINPPPAVKAMGVEAAFSKLDPSGSGSVSKQDFIKGMESLMAQAQAKEASAKAAAAPASAPAAAPKAQVSSAPAPSAPANIPPPAANGPIGNTINI